MITSAFEPYGLLFTELFQHAISTDRALRAISNLPEEPDRRRWQIDEALEALAAAVVLGR